MSKPTPEQLAYIDRCFECCEGEVVFLHHKECAGFCDYSCGGCDFDSKGDPIDVLVRCLLHQRDEARRQRDHYKAERDRLAEAMREIAEKQCDCIGENCNGSCPYAVAIKALSSLSEPKEQQP